MSDLNQKDLRDLMCELVKANAILFDTTAPREKALAAINKVLETSKGMDLSGEIAQKLAIVTMMRNAMLTRSELRSVS